MAHLIIHHQCPDLLLGRSEKDYSNFHIYTQQSYLILIQLTWLSLSLELQFSSWCFHLATEKIQRLIITKCSISFLIFYNGKIIKIKGNTDRTFSDYSFLRPKFHCFDQIFLEWLRKVTEEWNWHKTRLGYTKFFSQTKLWWTGNQQNILRFLNGTFFASIISHFFTVDEISSILSIFR